MPNRRRYFGLLLAALLAAPGQGLAGDSLVASADRIAALARGLDATDFNRRRHAEAELLKLGPRALPALRDARASADLEARYRINRIITALKQQRRSMAVCELQIGGQPDDPQLLAAWMAFTTIAGTGAESRDLFSEMVQTEPWIVDAVSGSPEQLRLRLERRAADISLQRMQRQQTHRSIATVAALLFAAQQPDCYPSSPALGCINGCIQEGPCLQSMQRDLRPEPLERLIAVWVSSPKTTPAYQRLQLAATFELAEGIDVALQIIEQHLPGPQLQQAILYLAKAGNTAHLHELELLLSDTTTLQRRRQHSVTTFRSRVQDVALVALLHLTHQDPQAYGFRRLSKDSKYVYKPGTIGFDDDDQRQAAFAKWKRWSAQFLKQVQPVVEQAAAGYSA